MSEIVKTCDGGHKFHITGTMAVGGTITVVVEPLEGYTFVKWVDDTGITKIDENTYQITISECGVEYIGIFEEQEPSDKYTVSWIDPTTGGVITATYNGNSISNGDSVDPGYELVLTCTALDGYTFDDWMRITSDFTIIGNVATLDNLESNISDVTATCTPNPYELSWNPNILYNGLPIAGNVQVSDTSITNPSNVNYGTEVKLTATYPVEQFNFSKWVGNGIPNNVDIYTNPLVFNMPSNNVTGIEATVQPKNTYYISFDDNSDLVFTPRITLSELSQLDTFIWEFNNNLGYTIYYENGNGEKQPIEDDGTYTDYDYDDNNNNWYQSMTVVKSGNKFTFTKINN